MNTKEILTDDEIINIRDNIERTIDRTKIKDGIDQLDWYDISFSRAIEKEILIKITMANLSGEKK